MTNSSGHRCNNCFKNFGRRDTLLRHMRVHTKQKVPRRSRRKSCVLCWKAKIKCLGEKPSCSTCLKRGASCSYNSNGGIPGESFEPSPAGSMQSTSPSRNTDEHDSPSSPNVDANCPLSPTSGPEIVYSQSDMQHAYDGPISNGGVVGNGLQMNNPQASASFDFFENLTNPNFGELVDTTAFDWLFTNDIRDDLTMTPFMDPICAEMPSNNTDMNHSADIGQHPQLNRDPQFNTQNMNHLHGLPVPRPQNRCDPDDPWPMEWYAAPDQPKVLPPLGHRDEIPSNGASYYQIDHIDESTRGLMQQNIQLTVGSTPWGAISLANFPSSQKLDHCIDIYFVRFHPMLPIIHRPTYHPTKDPIVLTLAIASIGASYSNFDGARLFANALSELTRRLLLFMGEHDPRFTRTDYYIAAHILQGTYGFSSGSKRLFELSETFRCSLVNNARCMGLFQDPRPTVPVADDDESRWIAWIADEKLCRLGWAVYECDASVSYMHNKRPSIMTSEITMRLPSSISHWEANSAQTWAALHPWGNNYVNKLSFRVAIRSLFGGSPSIAISEGEHRLIMVITLTRFLWSLKELESSPIHGLVPGVFQIEEQRTAMLSTLDSLAQSPAIAAAGSTKRSLGNLIQRVQVIHMAHLYAAGSLMDWLHPLMRGGRSEEVARAHMLHWGEEDAVRVRRVAYHCAQILATARQFLFNLPLEAFNVFHCGMVLSCMASLLARQNLNGGGERGANAALPQPPPLRIDDLVRDNELRPARIDEWIVHGGQEIVGVYGVPNLACQRGKLQVLEQTAEMLESMPVWGIAQNFRKVILRLIRSEE